MLFSELGERRWGWHIRNYTKSAYHTLYHPSMYCWNRAAQCSSTETLVERYQQWLCFAFPPLAPSLLSHLNHCSLCLHSAQRLPSVEINSDPPNPLPTFTGAESRPGHRHSKSTAHLQLGQVIDGNPHQGTRTVTAALCAVPPALAMKDKALRSRASGRKEPSPAGNGQHRLSSRSAYPDTKDK